MAAATEVTPNNMAPKHNMAPKPPRSVTLVLGRGRLGSLSRNGFVVDLQRFAQSTIVDPAADKRSRHARPRCLTPALPRRLAGSRWAPTFYRRAPTVHQFVPLMS
jgi:hypothetical protein